MIGPSSGAGGGVSNRELPENQSRGPKKRLFEELDIENFCEEMCQAGRKRYLPELETPIELVPSNQIIGDPTTLFSPLSGQEATDECSVARLEVLLVDGTNCTWTTVSDLEHQQALIETPPTSCSPSSTDQSKEHALPDEIQMTEPAGYQIGSGYWQPIVTLPPVQAREIPVNDASHHRLEQQQQQQQQQLQQQPYDDQETGNLSWLLDFKLDPFIEAADDRSIGPSPRDNHYGSRTRLNGRAYGSCPVDLKRSQNESSTVHQEGSQGYLNSDSRNLAAARCNGPKKPPFTYTELIEHALQERGELTVSAIYQWISEHFPYYKSNDDRWKNSVRHNLSINPHFRKGSKAPHGAGHLWAIANRGDSRPRQMIGLANNYRTVAESESSKRNRNTTSQTMPMDEVEAATASIAQPGTEEETAEMMNAVTLEHCAEQILSGIKKEVEVQYLVPMMVSSNQHEPSQSGQEGQPDIHYPVKESDFLNPVSKEVLAEECGLISEGYLVTDLNPTTLGLNMVEQEIISPENLFGEELSFQFYELTSPSQIQSA